VVLHELGFFPFQQLAFGIGGTALVVAGVFSDVVKFFERIGPFRFSSGTGCFSRRLTMASRRRRGERGLAFPVSVLAQWKRMGSHRYVSVVTLGRIA